MKKLVTLALLSLIAIAAATAQNAPFITVWITNNPSSTIYGGKPKSTDKQIYFPGVGTGYTIEWEEVDNSSNKGTLTNVTSKEFEPVLISFPKAGTYLVKVLPSGFNRIIFYNGGYLGDAEKIIEVRQWGDVAWDKNMSNAFAYCKNMNVTAEDAPDLSAVKFMDIIFYECKKFNGNINHWDVSNVTEMRGVFWGCTAFNMPLDKWNVSNVTGMGSMFEKCTTFNQPLNTWDVSNVTDMGYMFNQCTAFNQPLDKWNVSNVTRMGYMFYQCTAFNQPLNTWNVGNVTDMDNMFYGCTSFDQDINTWNVEKVVSMVNLFDGCTAFNKPLNDWNIVNVTNMNGVFAGCTSFNQPLDKWDVSNVTDMSYMFSSCQAFNQPLNYWDVSNVIEMNGMFSYCQAFNQPLNNWDVSNVIEMNGMFRNCKIFNQDLSSWDVSSVTAMQNMFNYCQAFNQSLGSWNIKSVMPYNGALLKYSLSGMLDLCGMSCENYDATLMGWAANPETPDNLTLDAINLKYSRDIAIDARNKLTNKKKWTINSDARSNCYIPIPVTDVKLSYVTHTLRLDEVLSIQAIVQPANATHQNVMWNSSNPDIATVNNKGKVTAIAVGTTTITATTNDGSKTASCAVTVGYPITVSGICITPANAANVLDDGKVSYKHDTKTLTLNGADIHNYEIVNYGDMSSGYYSISANQDLNIELKGDNRVTMTGADDGGEVSGYGISAKNVKIFGSGSLTLNIKRESYDAAENEYNAGISVQKLEISGSKIISAAEVGISSLSDIIISDGATVEAGDGNANGKGLRYKTLNLYNGGATKLMEGNNKATAQEVSVLTVTSTGLPGFFYTKPYVSIAPSGTGLPSLTEQGITVRGGKGAIHIMLPTPPETSSGQALNGENIRVYNIHGILEYSHPIPTGHVGAFTLTPPPEASGRVWRAGIYIVRIGDGAEKVIVW